MGKTHFCANLHGHKYKTDISTDGIVFSDITVSDTTGQDVEFKILDFAGQEVRLSIFTMLISQLGILSHAPVLFNKALHLYSDVQSVTP